MSQQRILVGHVLDKLATLPADSVHCVVTSPPYYGLRAYGTEPQVWDGDPTCAHQWGEASGYTGHRGNRGQVPQTKWPSTDHYPQSIGTTNATCAHCGAWRGELGQEPTVDLYIAHLVDVFRAVRRVLRPDGTLWLNIGDSYCGGGYGNHDVNGADWKAAAGLDRRRDRQQRLKAANSELGIKPKDLMLVPEMVALALRADGWWVRSRIIWAKKSSMPESVTDRPTNTHEHIWLLTKSARYFFDAEAVVEPSLTDGDKRFLRTDNTQAFGRNGGDSRVRTGNPTGPTRNLRNVWHLGPDPFPEAHFATFPTEIPRRAILAGTSEKGVCAACGAPWERVARRGVEQPHVEGSSIDRFGTGDFGIHRKVGGEYQQWLDEHPKRTIGWVPTCACYGRWDVVTEPNPLYEDGDEWVPDTVTRRVYVPGPNDPPPIPATVLDPFGGSGTALVMAAKLDRDGIAIDLNGEYAQMMHRRVSREGAPLFGGVVVEP